MPKLAVSGAIDQNSTVCRTANHFKADHEGDSIIMSIEAGKFFTFDAIGFEIWESIAEPILVGDLVSELANKHGETSERVLKDVISFLDRLAQESLLEEV